MSDEPDAPGDVERQMNEFYGAFDPQILKRIFRVDLPNCHTVPLLPRHKIRLFCVDGDGERFAGLFRQTWRKLSLTARRALLKHWRGLAAYSAEMPALEALDLHFPLVVLAADKSRFVSPGSGHCIAYYGRVPPCLAFHALWMDSLPDFAVEYTIAHELAHAFLTSDGSESHSLLVSPHTGTEAEADELAMEWGFDMDAKNDAFKVLRKRLVAAGLVVDNC